MIFFLVILIFSFSIWYFTYKYLKTSFEISSTFLKIYSLIFWVSIFFRNFYYLQYDFTKTPIFIALLQLDAFLLALIAYFHIIILIFIIYEKISRKLITTNSPNYFKDKRKGRRLFLGLSSLSPLITIISNYKITVPKTKIVKIVDDKYPKDIQSLKIGQLTDIHIGPTLKRDFLEKVCKQLMNEKPDIIFITGDIVDGKVQYLKDDLKPFEMLKAKYGVFLVDGNHEYYWNINEWRDFYKKSPNIKMLNNENQTINIGGKNILIAGVTDYRAHRFDEKFRSSPTKAVYSTLKHDYKILLAHRPKSCDEASRVGFNLQVSGHTHGGQSFPFNFIVGLVQPYLSGLYKHKGMNLYVSNGTGFWGPRMRLGIPAEVTIINVSNS